MNDAATPDKLLVRALGVRQLAAAIFNYTVGSGIFVLPAFAVAQLGSAAPLAFIACMGIMILVLFCFAEAGSRVSLTGGPYAYVETALGPLVGFIAGVMLYITSLAAGAAVTVLFAGSVCRLLGIETRWVAVVIMLTTTLLLVAINIRGVSRSARTLEIITVAKILPLLLFVVLGAPFISRANLAWQNTPDLATVLGTAGIVIFAFSGIESALAPSGEVRNPSRTIPKAAFIALGAATALYLAIQWTALGIKGIALSQNPVTPLAEAAHVIAGRIGRTFMIAAASISMLGYLSANILSAPRCLFAYGRDRFFPQRLSSVHAEYHTPHVAILVHGALVLAVALTGTFERLAVFSNLAAFVLYALCACAVWVLRRKDVRSDGPPFLMPGGPLIPLATFAVTVALIVVTAKRSDIIGIASTVAIGLLLYVRRQRCRT